MDSIFQVFPASPGSLEHVDGLPDPRDGKVQRLFFADGSVPPQSLDTHVKGFWSPSSLFINFSGRFLKLRMMPGSLPPPAARRTPNLWQLSDVYEVMIGRDCERTGRYREFQVAPDGRWLAADIGVKGDQVLTDQEWDGVIHCVSEVHEEENIWKAEVEIPWVLLGGREGMGEWKCNFYRATGRFHGEELLAWCPTGYGENCFHRPHLFGTLRVLGERDG